MTPQPIRRAQVERWRVEVYATKAEASQAAAARAAETLQELIARQGQAVVLFATGASQFDFVAALRQQAVDWQRVIAGHLDEYLGMSPDHPASFRRWLRERVEEPLRPGAFHYIHGDAPDPLAECRRYEAWLRSHPPDLGFVGIGENGHIAFNDPPVADFADPHWVKVVELDEACRRQQLGEGWFPTLESVPTHALTLTVPAILSIRRILSVVPEQRKARAVRDALLGPVSTRCPASILRTHPDATLFLDEASASELGDDLAWEASS